MLRAVVVPHGAVVSVLDWKSTTSNPAKSTIEEFQPVVHLLLKTVLLTLFL